MQPLVVGLINVNINVTINLINVVAPDLITVVAHDDDCVSQIPLFPGNK